ncbi:cytochrome c peroxidase [soil metagenome]
MELPCQFSTLYIYITFILFCNTRQHMRNFQVMVLIGLFAVLVSFISIATRPDVPTTPYEIPQNSDSRMSIPADNPTTVEGVALGRLLFYENLLSGNGKQNCGSCHRQEYSFTDGLAKAIGSMGDTLERNTMSLVNLAWQSEFFWDGRIKTLEKLVAIPITHPKEMAQDTLKLVALLQNHSHYPALFNRAFGSDTITFTNVSKALAQFLRTIVTQGIVLPDHLKLMPVAGVSFYDQYKSKVSDTTHMGLFIRVSELCSSCHKSSIYSGFNMDFNMVNDSAHLMKVPTLINIKHTGPYMHDGRFATLSDVVKHYDEHISKLSIKNLDAERTLLVSTFTEYDKRELEQFFDLFTDTTLLTNPAYSNPFIQPSFNWDTYLSESLNVLAPPVKYK